MTSPLAPSTSSAKCVLPMAAAAAKTGGEVDDVVSASAADDGDTMRYAGGFHLYDPSTRLSRFKDGRDLEAGRYEVTVSEVGHPARPVTSRGASRRRSGQAPSDRSAGVAGPARSECTGLRRTGGAPRRRGAPPSH